MNKLYLFFFSFFFSFLSFATTTIAVLPYKVFYDGRIPKKFTTEQLEEKRLQDAESYQQFMINHLLKTQQKRKYAFQDVVILGQEQVAAILDKNGVNLAKLDSLTNQDLERILGVTHVLRGTATRNFIMSDEMSLGMSAIGVLSGRSMNNTTSEINISNSLNDIKTNQALVTKFYTRSTTATRNDERVLRTTFRNTSKKIFKELHQN